MILFIPISPHHLLPPYPELLRAYRLGSLSSVTGWVWETRGCKEGEDSRRSRVSVPGKLPQFPHGSAHWLHSTMVQPLEDGLSYLKPSCGSRGIHLFLFPFGSGCVRGTVALSCCHYVCHLSRPSWLSLSTSIFENGPFWIGHLFLVHQCYMIKSATRSHVLTGMGLLIDTSKSSWEGLNVITCVLQFSVWHIVNVP